MSAMPQEDGSCAARGMRSPSGRGAPGTGGRSSAWRHWTLPAVAVSFATIFAFDLSMPLGVAAALPYIAVILLGYWSPHPQFCLSVASVATVLTLGAIGFKPLGAGLLWMAMLNRGLTVACIWVVAYLVVKCQARDARLRAVVDGAVDGIVTVDACGLIQSFNPGAERMFGYRAADVLGCNIGLLMPEPDASRHGAYLQRYLNTGVPKVIGRGREVTARRADGTTFPIKLSISEIRAADGPSFAGIMHDMTDLRRAEDELRRHRDQLQEQVDERTKELVLAKAAAEQAYRTKSAFLANMSHELRTPLNAVIGFSELLKSKTFGDLNGKQHEYLDTILTSARHLLALINDVLDMSKAEAGGVKLREEAVAVVDLVEQARRVLEPAIVSGDLAFAAELAGDCEVIRADRRLIFQVLLNLLSNACKFTRRGGRVSVAATRLGHRDVSIQIADTGIGMTAQEVATALTPFGRADNALTRSSEGTGLGLSLSKTLVELHGGTLEIASKPGEGTVVTVLLPGRLVEMDAASAA